MVDTPSNEIQNEYDKFNFHNACAQGNLSVVKVYLDVQGFDTNAFDNLNGITGFHYACQFGKLNVVQFLVQQEFDMNVRDNSGKNGFHLACGRGNLDVVQFLVEHGFDMNVSSNDGCTGFHLACRNGRLNVVAFLLQNGFDMNIGNDIGETGFHRACHNGSFNVVQFLVQRGFEGINQLNVHGETGLTKLIRSRWLFSQSKPFIPCLLLLIESGAQVDENYLFEELISAIQIRIMEITFMKQTIFEKWTGRIAQAITDFTISPVTNTSLQNLWQVLWIKIFFK